MSNQFRRNTAVTLTVLMLGMMLTALLAAPASAEIRRGSCVGQAEFPSKSSDKTLTADRPTSSVFLVPKTETVTYAGALSEGAQPFDSPIPFEGGISVQLPRTTWQFVSWGGESTQVSAEGVYTYSVPSFVPAGTGEFEVTGWHKQGDIDCAVVVTVALDGEPGPAALVAAAGTVVFGAGVLAAGSKKGVKS
ncbi:MAG: hypothetical protein U9R51_00325 [Actinomycetota bacterium]|nr:hypothetical protein [Actinomycetota bacterium]